jgi:hypothetical protein
LVDHGSEVAFRQEATGSGALPAKCGHPAAAGKEFVEKVARTGDKEMGRQFLLAACSLRIAGVHSPGYRLRDGGIAQKGSDTLGNAVATPCADVFGPCFAGAQGRPAGGGHAFMLTLGRSGLHVFPLLAGAGPSDDPQGQVCRDLDRSL